MVTTFVTERKSRFWSVSFPHILDTRLITADVIGLPDMLLGDKWHIDQGIAETDKP